MIPVENQKLTLKQAKKAKAFVVTLTPGAVAQFERLKALAEPDDAEHVSPWVLGSERSHNGHFSDKAIGRCMRRVWQTHPALQRLPLASPHDLRRTCRTWLGKLGTPPHVAEHVLNHAVGGRVMLTYDHYRDEPERRAALEKWDAFVHRLLAPAESNALPEEGSRFPRHR